MRETFIENEDHLPKFEERLELYGVEPTDGKGVFSLLFPHDFFYKKGADNEYKMVRH